MSGIPKRRRRSAPAGKQRRKRRQKKQVPTVDLHIRIGLEDWLVRISAADFQRFLHHWVLAEQTVILRGPYDGMETDIILRGGASGSYSVRSYAEGEQRPRNHAFKLVVADEIRMEMLESAGL